MNGERWHQIQEMFHAAVVLSEPERRWFLQANCGADAELMDAVAAMLIADEDRTSLLDRGLPEIAFEMLETAADAQEMPPAVEIGPYRLMNLLGEGGMGVVWLAERTDTGNQVAIKFLPNAGLSPARRDRFTQEVRLLARLRHSCIARLYDAGTLSDGTPWFVMEYVAGAPFTEHCRSLDSIDKKLILFRAVCEAVQYAHGKEIIHRDLKPSNILVEADGTPKLLDFGIARELRQPDGQSGLTARSPRFMSQHYSAPEWVQEAAVGFTTDVYSLGVMLYEILTGQLPFPGEGLSSSASSGLDQAGIVKPSQAIRNHALDETRQAGKAKGTASIGRRSDWNDLDVLSLKAMHPDPGQRYGSVEALIRDIGHYLRGEPLEARPDSWKYRSAKFVRRKSRTVVISVSALLLIITMVVMFTVRLAYARNAAVAEAARANRIQQFTLGLFKSSVTFSDAPNNLTVETLVDRGVADAGQLDHEPALQAELYRTLGQMYQDIGKPTKADPVYSKALAILDKLPNSPVRSLINTRIELASVCAEENKEQDADILTRAAIQLIANNLPEDRALRARADSLMGGVLTGEGKYAAGERMLKSAATVQEASKSQQSDLAVTLYALSNVELYLGHYEDSDAASIKLLSIYESPFGSNNPRASNALQNLGESAEVRGRYAQAERYERQALNIVEAWYGKEHRITANKMTSLATTLIDEGRYAEADRMLQTAIAVQEKVYPANSHYMIKTLRSLGMLQAALGNSNAALRTFDREMTISQEDFANDNYVVARAMLDKGSAYLQMKEYSQAENLIRSALRILLNARGENDVYTATARVRLGHALLYEKRYREAEEQTRIGYETLKKLYAPNTSLLQGAHEDLVAIYQGLNGNRTIASLK